MGQYLAFVTGEAVRLGKLTLPGVVESLSVGGTLSIDEQDLENTNLKALAVQGYTTQTVQIGLRLTAETQAALDHQVRQLQQAFQVDRIKKAGAKLVPVRMVNPHLDSRRIKVVVFDGLTTTDGPGELEVTAALSLHEFESDVAKLQDRIAKEAARRAKAKKTKAGGPNGTPSPPGGGKNTTGAGGKAQLPGPLQDGLRGYNDGFGAAAGLFGK